MPKYLVTTCCFFAAPAFAAPLRLDLDIHVGQSDRHYAVVVVPDAGDARACATASSTEYSTGARPNPRQDNIAICARDAGAATQLNVDWKTREIDHEVRDRSQAIVVPGDRLALASGDAQLTITASALASPAAAAAPQIAAQSSPVVPPPGSPPVSALPPPAELVSQNRPQSPDRAHEILLEVGPTIGLSSGGLEAELAVPLSDRLRLGVFGGANLLFDNFGPYHDGMIYDAGVEFGVHGHGVRFLELGLVTGLFHGGNPPSDTGFAGLRLGAVRQYTTGNLELSVEPMIVFGSALYDGPGLSALTVMSSLRWQWPI